MNKLVFEILIFIAGGLLSSVSSESENQIQEDLAGNSAAAAGMMEYVPNILTLLFRPTSIL